MSDKHGSTGSFCLEKEQATGFIFETGHDRLSDSIIPEAEQRKSFIVSFGYFLTQFVQIEKMRFVIGFLFFKVGRLARSGMLGIRGWQMIRELIRLRSIPGMALSAFISANARFSRNRYVGGEMPVLGEIIADRMLGLGSAKIAVGTMADLLLGRTRNLVPIFRY